MMKLFFEEWRKKILEYVGKTIDEIMTILNGLEIERITNIKMTMKNLSYLFEEVMKEQNKKLQENLNKMINNHL